MTLWLIKQLPLVCNTDSRWIFWQIFRIGTVCYAEGLWRMRRHGPVIAHCTNSEDFPIFSCSDAAQQTWTSEDWTLSFKILKKQFLLSSSWSDCKSEFWSWYRSCIGLVALVLLMSTAIGNSRSWSSTWRVSVLRKQILNPSMLHKKRYIYDCSFCTEVCSLLSAQAIDIALQSMLNYYHMKTHWNSWTYGP